MVEKDNTQINYKIKYDATYKFRERLLNARGDQKLTQAELSERVGVSTTTISDYERGDKQPGINTAVKLSHALKVNLDWLCGNDQNKAYELNPKLALFDGINVLKMNVEEVTDDKVILSFSDYGEEISALEIKCFFEELRTAQMVYKAYGGRPGFENITDKVKENFLDRFKNFPQLPNYQTLKKYE